MNKKHLDIFKFMYGVMENSFKDIDLYLYDDEKTGLTATKNSERGTGKKIGKLKIELELDGDVIKGEFMPKDPELPYIIIHMKKVINKHNLRVLSDPLEVIDYLNKFLKEGDEK